jgi:hypothetical protein
LLVNHPPLSLAIDTHGLTPVVLKPKKSLQENLTLSPPGLWPGSSAQVLIVSFHLFACQDISLTFHITMEYDV